MSVFIKRSSAFIFLMFFTSSCMTQRFYLTDEPLPNREADYNKMQHFFLSGLAQENRINVKNVCNDRGASHIETKLSFVDVILSLISRGIYTPRTAKVYCK